MRNWGMGSRRGLPVVQMPVVRSLIMSASLAGGVPPMRGALSGQFWAGLAGSQGTGDPWSHRVWSRFPLASRGVWHCPQTATDSTMYLPRATSAPPIAALPGCCGLSLLGRLVFELSFWANAPVAPFEIRTRAITTESAKEASRGNMIVTCLMLRFAALLWHRMDLVCVGCLFCFASLASLGPIVLYAFGR